MNKYYFVSKHIVTLFLALFSSFSVQIRLKYGLYLQEEERHAKKYLEYGVITAIVEPSEFCAQ